MSAGRASASLPGLARVRERVAALARQAVEIGVPASARYPDGTSVAQVAAYNEFGTDTIPSRPAIREGVKAATPKAQALNKLNLPRVLDGRMAAGMALAQIGELGVSEVKRSILTGPWVPNSPATIRRKGSSKPLVDTSQYHQSISSRVVSSQ